MECMLIDLFRASFLIGAPLTCAVIQIPQRFQTVNGLDPFQAGVRLLAFIAMVPVGAVIGVALAKKYTVKPTYALLGGTVFQLVGAICFATQPYSTEIQSFQYGFQVLFGIGSGVSNAIGTTSVPFIVRRVDIRKSLLRTSQMMDPKLTRNIAAALGANTQFRYLGGAVGLWLITSVLNSKLRPELASILSPEQIAAVLQSAEIIKSLPDAQREQVLSSFASGFTLLWKVILAFICGQVPAAIMML